MRNQSQLYLIAAIDNTRTRNSVLHKNSVQLYGLPFASAIESKTNAQGLRTRALWLEQITYSNLWAK